MEAAHTIELLKQSYDENQLNQLLEKVVGVALSQQQQGLRRYERDLAGFEAQYGMESHDFYERFEKGAVGDAIDFFEWASLFELKQELEKKILKGMP